MEQGNSDEVSFTDIFSGLKQAFRYLVNKWWLVLLAALVGGLAGIWYAGKKPTTYTAKLSFILEERGAAAGGLASLAGQFGFDLGGLSGGSGPLSADNVNLFLTSSSLTAETLLTPYDTARGLSLADRYAEVYELKKQWKKSPAIGKDVTFPSNATAPFSRLQDSLLQVLIERVSKDHISITKPDRKASFIEVSATTTDEMLSKFYCERLVNAAIERYIDVKTNRQAKNVSRLQARADSISALLNRKTYSSAAAQQQVLDINPALRSMASVPAEVIGRDKVMLSTIYGEIVKNLEISKVALSQETPVIQIIDDVRLPLKKKTSSKMIFGLAGALLLLLLVSGLIIVQYALFIKGKGAPTA